MKNWRDFLLSSDATIREAIVMLENNQCSVIIDSEEHILGTITDPPQNPIAATHEKRFASGRLKCSIRLSSLIMHIDNKIVQ